MSSRRWGRSLAVGFLLLLLLASSLLAGWSAPGGHAALPVSRLALGDTEAVAVWWALATRTVLGIVAAATLVAATIGVVLGALSVLVAGGSGLLTRLVELSGSVPALILVGIWRSWDVTGGLWALIGALAMLRSLEVAQLVRARVLATLPTDFVEASRALGATRRWQLRAHVVPRLVRPVLVNLCSGAASLVGLEAALSFTGLGLPDDVPSWGGGLATLAGAGHAGALAGVIVSIGLASAAFYGLGVSLSDAAPKPAPRALAPAGAQVK